MQVFEHYLECVSVGSLRRVVMLVVVSEIKQLGIISLLLTQWPEGGGVVNSWHSALALDLEDIGAHQTLNSPN